MLENKVILDITDTILNNDLLKENLSNILLEYTLDKEDINVIRDIIRDEVADIMRDLWKKRNIWI